MRFAVAVMLASILGIASTQARTTPALADVMSRVGRYVERYGEEASVLIAVEHYAQRTQTGSHAQPTSSIVRQPVGNGPTSIGFHSEVVSTYRNLVSEFALVRSPSSSAGWVGFRDVIEVDGNAVPDRDNRLQTLFQGQAPDLEQAWHITADSARFNLGTIQRTFNIPTAVLFFFPSTNLLRFTFQRRGTERVNSINAWAIDFREVSTPTLIMTVAEKDVPASGVLWVDPADGSVLRTRLDVSGFAGDVASSAEVVVDYRRDPALRMWLPLKMTEKYKVATFLVSGQADYSDFKRFQTSAKFSIPK